MKHIIELPEGEIIVKKLTESADIPFNFSFELDCALPVEIEKKLVESVEKSKRDRYNEIVAAFPNRYEELGYTCVEDVPEYLVFTSLSLTFSEDGNGLIKSKIERVVSDHNLTLDTHFGCNAEVDIDLSDQVEDLRWLIHHYLDKMIFKKRVMENYIL